MYTISIINKSIDRTQRQLLVDVQFSSTKHIFNRRFTFGLDVDFATVKRAVKSFKDKLESTETKLDTIVEGELDFSDVPDETPTQAALDFQQWMRDFGRLETVQRLVNLGVVPNDNAKVLELRDKVRTDLKLAYIDQF